MERLKIISQSKLFEISVDTLKPKMVEFAGWVRWLSNEVTPYMARVRSCAFSGRDAVLLSQWLNDFGQTVGNRFRLEILDSKFQTPKF